MKTFTVLVCQSEITAMTYLISSLLLPGVGGPTDLMLVPAADPLHKVVIFQIQHLHSIPIQAAVQPGHLPDRCDIK